MHQLLRRFIITASTFACLSTAYATVPNTSDPTTFLGPTLRLGYTSPFTDLSALSVAGEAGDKNFRIGATIGFQIAENQFFKVSAENLWQKITYAFFSGNAEQWMHQAAFGAAYQYNMADYWLHPQLGLSAYVSHAPSKNLSTVSGSFMNAQDLPVFFNNFRRIAGSNSSGLMPSITLAPWLGSRVELGLNYDNTRYDDKYADLDDPKGIGGTIKIHQALTNVISMDLSAGIRKPFNNYAANLGWDHVNFYGDWSLGLFGEYTAGKATLPNTWNVGLSANYFLDQRCPAHVPANHKGEVPTSQSVTNNLLAWTADPAVYMPQVLAVTDQLVSTFCPAGSAPVLIAQLPEQITNPGFITLIPTAPSFSGSNLTFSVSVPPGSLSNTPPNSVTINPTTGVVSVNIALSSDLFFDPVTVTATNNCGSATMTFPISFLD